MAELVFHCPGCAARLAIDDRAAGYYIACPHCQAVIQVPLHEGASPLHFVPVEKLVEVRANLDLLRLEKDQALARLREVEMRPPDRVPQVQLLQDQVNQLQERERSLQQELAKGQSQAAEAGQAMQVLRERMDQAAAREQALRQEVLAAQNREAELRRTQKNLEDAAAARMQQERVAQEALRAGDIDTLAAYRDLAPGLPYAHPTVEHFTPLFVTLGAGSGEVTTTIDGYWWGLSRRSLQVA